MSAATATARSMAAAPVARPTGAAGGERETAAANKGAAAEIERDDSLNGLLDAIERLVDVAMDMGAAAPLAARLARLLPSPAPAKAPGDRSTPLSIEQQLALTQRLAGLTSIRARRLTDIERRAADAAADDVNHLIAVSRTGGTP